MRRREQWSKEPAPVHAVYPVVEKWLSEAPVDASFLAADAAWSPVFTSRSFGSGRRELDRQWLDRGSLPGTDAISWVGGPAVHPLPAWPRRPDRAPLAHVMTVSLADVDSWGQDDRHAWPDHRQGLPTTGALEVFHDLQTYGWEVADRETGAWLVRWVEQPDHMRFAEAPDDVDPPTEVCQAGMFLPGFSLRSPAECLMAGHDGFDAAELVTEQFQRAWLFQRTGSAAGHPVPVTHVYGHSQNGAAPALRVLADALPLEAENDSYRLILDIESWTHLYEWFGDAAPLEVWMRDSDLRNRRFDRAWCIMRTD